MTPLALLQNSSFLFEIKENLTLIPCTEQTSNQSNFIYNPTSRSFFKMGNARFLKEVEFGREENIRNVVFENLLFIVIKFSYLLLVVVYD